MSYVKYVTEDAVEATVTTNNVEATVDSDEIKNKDKLDDETLQWRRNHRIT